tara:strand:- start:530 stop:835 length:306 start_codon:yes stop_codon:yes gene_type:complete
MNTTWFFSLEPFTQIGSLYIAGITVLTFFFYGFDKMRSRYNDRRIPEKTLWFLALIGGSLGAIAGMSFFRHKTKKLSFQTGIALILMVQILLLYGVYQYTQ